LVDEAVQQMLPALVPIATSLTPSQIAHWSRYQARKDEEFMSDFSLANGSINPTRLQRAIERTERFYGPLLPEQREWLAQRLATSTFDPQTVLQERQYRQADAEQAVASIQAGANPLITLQQVWLRSQQSPRPAYAAYSQSMVQDGCEQFAQLHNLTTPEQRGRVVQRLQGFERDVLSLASR